MINMDEWTVDGARIDSDGVLRAVEALLERHSILVERGYYRRSRAPERRFFSEYDDFRTWMATLLPGDAVYVWDFEACCRNDNLLTSGKVPDSQGRVPTGGAY
jgi:hypothetical protein